MVHSPCLHKQICAYLLNSNVLCLLVENYKFLILRYHVFKNIQWLHAVTNITDMRNETFEQSTNYNVF